MISGEQWTIETSGERGSGKAVLAARHDDGDIYIYIYIYIYIHTYYYIYPIYIYIYIYIHTHKYTNNSTIIRHYSDMCFLHIQVRVWGVTILSSTDWLVSFYQNSSVYIYIYIYIFKLSAIWKSVLADRIKRIFFQGAVVSILLYRCTTWTLTKRMEKRLDGNYTRMLQEILKKSWRQHPTKPWSLAYNAEC